MKWVTFPNWGKLLIGFMMIQGCALMVMLDAPFGVALTFSEAGAIAGMNRVHVGASLPTFAVYDENGKRIDYRFHDNKKQVLIFVSCTCVAGKIKDWNTRAKSVGESASVIFENVPQKLKSFRSDFQLELPIYVARGRDIVTIVNAPPLPCAVHVDATGLITAVEKL